MSRALPYRYDLQAGVLYLLDQRRLPAEERWVPLHTAADVAEAIRAMVVRGAPAIGIAAAYGMVVAHRRGEDPAAADHVLRQSRPTAVNLAHALDALQPRWGDAGAVLAGAEALAREVERGEAAMAAHGAGLLRGRVLTHCNTGPLATGGHGTALGVIVEAHRRGRLEHVWVDETRPYLQGARLTAWELARAGVPGTVITDNTAASLMAQGRVDAVILGADRMAANGDFANKIGTLGLAVLARHFGLPFYVALPVSTIDLHTPDGAGIPIEERDPDEVRTLGPCRVMPEEIPTLHLAFDVTPAALVTAVVTERGVLRPPVEVELRRIAG
ncbi:MAG: S-methyl-5-thioribose-1-phosphate isomerase [Pseudomonadota bacterium]